MKLLSLLRLASLPAVLLMLTAGALAQAPTPTPHPLVSAEESIFSNKGEAPLSGVKNEAMAQLTAVPFYKSNGEETRFYEGYFKAATDASKLALLSDDGTSVWIDGEQVLDRAGKTQGFEGEGTHQQGDLIWQNGIEATFTPLSKTFSAGQIYHLKLQYTNTIHSGDVDVDGLSLWAYDGGGTIVNYQIDVDMDVDHTTPDGYPNSANGDRSEEEEAWEDSAAVFVLANQGDRDDDYVPGYADGIDLFGNGQANSCGSFSPMVVALNVPIDQVPLARVIFRYGASDPNQLQRYWDAAGDARYSLPDNNVIRIWKKDGPSVRNPKSIQNGGDFIQPGHSYSAEDLGWTGEGVLSVTFYVEVVDHTGAAGPRSMSVEFYASGNTTGGFNSVDTVKIQSTIVQSGNFGGSSG